MRILIVNPLLSYVFGGAEVNDLNLGKAFRGLGREVIHVAVRDPKKPGFIFSDDITVESVRMPYFYEIAVKARPTKILGALLRNIFFYVFRERLIMQKKDLIRSSDLILLTGKPLLSKTKLYTDATVLQSVRGKTNRFNLRYYDIVDGVIFWGGCHQEYGDSRIEKARSLILNPAIDKTIFYPGSPRSELRQELAAGRRDESTIILYTGRLDPVHQVDQIISACAWLIRNGLNVHLVVVGGGSMHRELETQAEMELPAGTFSFMGWRSPQEVADLLRAVDVFVINPVVTNHPIALMEAVACGTYAVAPRLGRVPTILGQDGFGGMFEPNNQNALNEALYFAVAERRFETSATRTTTPSHIHSWRDNARSILDWYKQYKAQS